MPSDIITENIATVGLMNGAVAIRPASGTDPASLFLAGNASLLVNTPDGTGFYEWLPKAGFEEAARLLAEALSEASIQDPDAYKAFVETVSEHGSTGRVLLLPPGGTWPDAAVGLVPWLPGTPGHMRDRCFPTLQILDFASYSEDGGGDGADPGYLASWCQENPNMLIRTDTLEDSIYCGWNSAIGQMVKVHAPSVDFSRPWRIISHPDGSEEIVPALPLRLEDPVFNYYEALPPSQEGE